MQAHTSTQSQQQNWTIERQLLDQALTYADNLRRQILAMGGEPATVSPQGARSPNMRSPGNAANTGQTQTQQLPSEQKTPISEAQRKALAKARKAKRQRAAAAAA